MKTASAKMDTLALVGDACLFTAAAFGPLVLVGGAPALVIGPAAAWFLHDRRLNGAAVMSGVIGLLLGVVGVGGFFVLAPLVPAAIGPVGGWEFAVPVAFLATASALFLALIVALDIDGLRDLLPAHRKHVRLDYARLVATLVVAVFAAVVSLLQTLYPETEIGDAGVFALGAAAVGAVTMFAMQVIYAYWEKRNGSASTLSSQGGKNFGT